jgi:hypothetical protein
MEAATVPRQATQVPSTRRRRGVIPGDLKARIDAATPEFEVRFTARLLGNVWLDGVRPSTLREQDREELYEKFGRSFVDPALEVLERIGYGATVARRSPAQRAHGLRREVGLQGLLGKLPRSLALRMPTTADTHRSGRNDGIDRWGQVRCSSTLRSDHLGLIAAAGGRWQSSSRDGEHFAEFTAGELVQLTTGRRRVGGKDVAEIHGRLEDLAQLELQADVRDRSSKEPRRYGTDAGETSGASEAHRIPSSPIVAVERRVGDRWYPAGAEYFAAQAAAGEGDGEDLLEVQATERGELPGQATIRIHLADWVRTELAHPKRRPVFINFDVWAHLRPSGRRTYAFVQALGRDEYDDRVYFYLGAPTLFTLGLSGKRIDRAASAVSHDLTCLWHADHRYHEGDGFRRHTHAGGSIPAFACSPARRTSAPTAKAQTTKSVPRRPGQLRGAFARMRRHAVTGTRHVSAEQLDPAHVREVGREAALREADAVRQAIQHSLAQAATSHEPGPFEQPARRQDRAGPDDDEPASP